MLAACGGAGSDSMVGPSEFGPLEATGPCSARPCAARLLGAPTAGTKNPKKITAIFHAPSLARSLRVFRQPLKQIILPADLFSLLKASLFYQVTLSLMRETEFKLPVRLQVGILRFFDSYQKRTGLRIVFATAQSSSMRHVSVSVTGCGRRPSSHSAHFSGLKSLLFDSITHDRKSRGPPFM